MRIAKGRWRLEQAGGFEAGSELLTSMVTQASIQDSWVRTSAYLERQQDLSSTFQGHAKHAALSTENQVAIAIQNLLTTSPAERND